MYYSLKTKKEEHALEPRLDGHFYYAVYDLEKNQKGDKQLIMKRDVTKFIFDKQTELKAKFEKVFLDGEPKEKDDKVFVVDKEEKEDKSEKKSGKKKSPKVLIAGFDGLDELPKELLDMLPKELNELENLFEKAGGEDARGFKHLHGHTAMKERGVSPEEYEKTKDIFSMKASFDFTKEKTVFDVSYSPRESADETHKHVQAFIEHFVPQIIEALPELVDNIICNSASASLDADIESAYKSYEKSELKRTVREHLAKAILRHIETSFKKGNFKL